MPRCSKGHYFNFRFQITVWALGFGMPLQGFRVKVHVRVANCVVRPPYIKGVPSLVTSRCEMETLLGLGGAGGILGGCCGCQCEHCRCRQPGETPCPSCRPEGFSGGLASTSRASLVTGGPLKQTDTASAVELLNSTLKSLRRRGSLGIASPDNYFQPGELLWNAAIGGAGGGASPLGGMVGPMSGPSGMTPPGMRMGGVTPVNPGPQLF